MSQNLSTPRRRALPRLRTLEPEAGERHASWIELFFDLVFVVAVSQLSAILKDNTDAAGVLRFLVLFVPVWWSWVGFTFYADRFESDEVSYRVLTFASMFAVTALAITLDGAFTPAGDAAFVGCYVLLRLTLIALYLRIAYYVPLARSYALQYPIGLGASVAIFLLSLLVPPPWRYAMWGTALLVELATPILNLRASRRLPLDRSHIPERFGLFAIIVLGEAVMATALGLSGAQWTPAAIGIGAAGFAMAAVIWWINFEFVEDSALTSGSLLQRFSFIYGHFFVVASIVAAGVGVEHAIKEAGEPHLHMPALLLIVVSLSTYLAAITAVRLITGICRLVYPRILCIVGLLSLLFVGQYVSPIVTVALALALLSAELWIETYFSEETEDDESQAAHLVPCDHAGEIATHTPHTSEGCQECVKNNYKWVRLRLCLSCGHVGCCDSSVHKHATKHFHASGHPIMESLEEAESWGWCYIDERFVPTS